MRAKLIFIAALVLNAAAAAVAVEPNAAADADPYANPDRWLCRPGRQDACSVAQDASVIAIDGQVSRETY